MIVIDLDKQKMKELRLPSSGAVDAGIKIHSSEYETYSRDPYDPRNALVFSAGPFAHPDIQGANRGVVSFRSPMTGGFFVSSAGGLGRYIALTGDRDVTIVGRAAAPAVVVVIGDSSGTTMQIFELSDAEDLINEGVFALSDFLGEELRDVYNGAPYRAVVAGPAARYSDFGVLASVDPVMKSVDFFGRGGAGSVMVRAHNVYAVVFGGDAVPTLDLDRFRKVAADVLGEDYLNEVPAATEKYRFSQKDGIGGTMLNWAHLKGLLPSYNWHNIYMSDSERERLWEELISPAVEKMRAGFSSKNIVSRTCGEKCAAACKKYLGDKKVDYEPITALGSQLGIFDLEKAVALAHLADRLGFDAIQLGDTIAWALELRDRGVLKIEGLPDTSLKPFSTDPDAQFQAVAQLITAMAAGKADFLAHGIRSAAAKIGNGAEDLAVFVPFAGGGELVPPQYIVPGFFVPLPLHGKFMTYYGSDWLDPKALGAKVWERFVAELLTENAGFCRFHRKWAENVIPAAYEAMYGVLAPLEAERLAVQIKQYQRRAEAESQPPVSQRVRDLLAFFARMHGQDAWAEKLATSEGLEEYILEVRKGISAKRASSVSV
ncbi:MAG: hypothetical protein GXN93_04475 [Candidatus Diapherotrites archaeon]|nr:hypothetical protein [Candidatus Diapherotrites archaeon]